jgi:hypothetical protein
MVTLDECQEMLSVAETLDIAEVIKFRNQLRKQVKKRDLQEFRSCLDLINDVIQSRQKPAKPQAVAAAREQVEETVQHDIIFKRKKKGKQKPVELPKPSLIQTKIIESYDDIFLKKTLPVIEVTQDTFTFVEPNGKIKPPVVKKQASQKSQAEIPSDLPTLAEMIGVDDKSIRDKEQKALQSKLWSYLGSSDKP